MQEGGPIEWQRKFKVHDWWLGFFKWFWHNHLESKFLPPSFRVIKRQYFLTRLNIRDWMFLPGRPNAPHDESCNDSSQRLNGRESYDVRVFEAQEQKSDNKSDHTDMEVRKKWDWRAITKQMKKKITHLYISNAYGKLNKTAKSSRGTLCVPFFLTKNSSNQWLHVFSFETWHSNFIH